MSCVLQSFLSQLINGEETGMVDRDKLLIDEALEHLDPVAELTLIKEEMSKPEVLTNQERREYLKRRLGLIMFHFERYQFALNHIEVDATVLDAACGEGYGTDVMARKAIVCGVDYDEQVIGVARKKYGEDERKIYEVRDLEKGRIGTYDIIVSFETLEHLKKPHAFMSKMKKNTSKIIASVPTTPTKHANPYHLHDFTVASFTAMAEKGGWQVIDVLNQQNAAHTFVITPA